MSETHNQKPAPKKRPEAERPPPSPAADQSKATAADKPSPIERSEWRGEGVCGHRHTD
jgi:hypothetical protein